MQTFSDSLFSINKKFLFMKYEPDNCDMYSGLIDDISELQRLISSDEEKIRWIDFVASLGADFSFMLSSYAMEQYKDGNFDISCYAYIRCIQISKESPVMIKNNLAYIIRRNESSISSLFSISEIAELLERGLENKNLFSIVNLALTFILRSGEDQDWHLADDLFAFTVEIDKDIDEVSSWWEEVGSSGDIEGSLVHFFLLRHKKIENSSLGTLEQLSEMLSKNIKGFPAWLAVCPEIES